MVFVNTLISIFSNMSYMVISDLLKSCLIFDFIGYCVTGHFKRLSAPRSSSDVKVIEVALQ